MSDYQPGAVPPSDDPLGDPAEAELLKRIAEAKALLDGFRPAAAASVGRFLEPGALEAAALLSVHDHLYMYQLERELRPHNILRRWQKAVAAAAKGLAETEIKIAEKTRFISLATELLELWHDRANVAWCWPKEHGPGCCWRVQSKEARIYLLRAYGQRHQVTLEDGRKVPASPGKQAVTEAMDALEAIAYGGPPRPTPALRVGGDAERLVIDLCNDDHTVVVVTAQGWQVVKPSPIPMRRVDGMLPLPTPSLEPGDALGELRDLLGFGDEPTLWAQLVGFQFSCLRPKPPYFVLGIFEEQGRGKTTTSRVLRQPIDPHETERQPKPKSPDDLYVCSYGQWLTAYDNLSALSQEYSDAFCCISTEATYAKRELFTNFGMIQLKLARPQIITAIVDVVAAPDLLDRSLVARLPEIGDLIDDDELLEATGALAPRILGQLLDAAALAIRGFAETKVAERVRMVGPTCWIEAGAAALGLAPGEFVAAYLESVNRAHEIALEASVIGGPLRRMLDLRDGWARLAEKEGEGYAGTVGFVGTADALLRELNEFVRGEPRPFGWPASARGLSGQLRRVAPALRKLGYRVAFGSAGRDVDKHREITIDTALSYARKTLHVENNRPHRSHRPQSVSGTTAAGAAGGDGGNGGDGRIQRNGNRGHSSERPNGPAPRTAASVPFIITQRMKADLRSRGFTDAQIKKMTPAQAHRHLTNGAAGGGREDLGALCRRAAEAKGKDAVEAICKRHGVTGGGFSRRRLDDLESQEAEQLRSEVEALLS